MDLSNQMIYCIRVLWAVINVTYGVPAYLAFMLLLYPFKYLKRDFYIDAEGYLFRRLIRCVSHWRSSAGYDIVEYGTDPSVYASEYVLLLANHTSTADVPVLMGQFAARKPLIENVMWIMDSIFRFVPFGWVSMARGDFFVRCGKSCREESLAELKQTLQRTFLRLRRRWLVLFPEGGFISKRKESSQRYARENGFPHLEYVSLPRMGCLKQILPSGTSPASELKLERRRSDPLPNVGKRMFTYIADVTIAYDGGEPMNFEDLVIGWLDPTRRIHVHYDFVPVDQVPTGDTELRDWLFARWARKDEILTEFAKTGSFPLSCKRRGIDSRTRFNLVETASDNLFFLFWAVVFAVTALKSSPWLAVFLLLLPCLRFSMPDLFYEVEGLGAASRLFPGYS